MVRRHSVAARALALLNELRTRTDERGTASSNPSPSSSESANDREKTASPALIQEQRWVERFRES
jgi:hypothetical protein